jgi:hypothetical protein
MSFHETLEHLFDWRRASPRAELSADAKELIMAVSAQFQTALTNLVDAYEAKITALQAQIVPASPPDTSDADDTTALVDALATAQSGVLAGPSAAPTGSPTAVLSTDPATGSPVVVAQAPGGPVTVTAVTSGPAPTLVAVDSSSTPTVHPNDTTGAVLGETVTAPDQSVTPAALVTSDGATVVATAS